MLQQTMVVSFISPAVGPTGKNATLNAVLYPVLVLNQLYIYNVRGICPFRWELYFNAQGITIEYDVKHYLKQSRGIWLSFSIAALKSATMYFCFVWGFKHFSVNLRLHCIVKKSKK